MRKLINLLICTQNFQRVSGILLIALLLCLMTNKVYAEETIPQYSEEEKRTILSMVKPSPVVAKVKHISRLMMEPSDSARVIQNMEIAQEVEIMMDYSAKWYFVMDYRNEKKGWIASEDLDIPEDIDANANPDIEIEIEMDTDTDDEPDFVSTTDIPNMSQKQLEGYVNIKRFQSNSDYLVWTDISRQLTHIFKGTEGKWLLQKTIQCSTGKNTSPTVRGIFKTQDRGEWFYSDRLESGAKYWVRFHGTYLYHSLIMDKNKNVMDFTLGKRQSSGCVRLSIEDAEWFYLTIPTSTTVFID